MRCHSPGRFHRVLVGDLHHLVDNVEVEHVRNKSGADALNRVLARLDVLAGLALRDDRAIDRLDGHDLHVRLATLEHFAHAGDGAAGADARYKNVDLAVGVAPNLLGRGLAMDFRVGRVLELLRDEPGLVLGRQFIRLAYRARHPFGRRREDHFGAKRFEQPATFEAHALGHGHFERISARRADKRQRNARVATGRLDDHGVFLDLAVALGGVDHGPAEAVLDAPQGVAVFEFAHHRRSAALRHAAQPYQGSVPDATGDVVLDSLDPSFNCRGHGRSSRK